MTGAAYIGAGRPNYLDTLVKLNGTNPDLMRVIESKTEEATSQCKVFAERFRGANNRETALNIWNYLKSNIPYKADGSADQRIKAPNRLVADASLMGPTDCKSFSLFTVGCLRALGLPAYYRYASYTADPTPTHVYSYTLDEAGRPIIIDAVYSRFNAEAPYVSKKDVKMNISYLSGIPGRPSLPVKAPNNTTALQRLIGKVQKGSVGYYILKNELERQTGGRSSIKYSYSQITRYKAFLSKRLANKVPAVLRPYFNAELNALNNGMFYGVIPPQLFRSAAMQGFAQSIAEDFENDDAAAMGKISFKKLKRSLKKISIKKIFKGVKAVGLVVPRKAFLGLVALNVRGLATRLTKAPANKVKKQWEKMGGKPSVLMSAISKGAKKRPLLGGGRIKSIKGIGFVYDDAPNGIGAAPAVGAWLAAAGPVLIAFMQLLKGAGVPEVEGTTESEILTEANENGAPGIIDSVTDFFTRAVDTAQNTGLLPERPLNTGAEQMVEEEIPGDDHDDGIIEGKSGKTLLLLGLGLVAFFALTR